MVVSAEIAGERRPRSESSVAIPGLREPLFAWALHGVFAVLTFVTYARIAPDSLYHVSREGLAGGASRTLVYLNFPLAFAAIAILALCAARLRRPGATALAAAGAALCATAALPGIVDADDLDARPVNALPALGVAVAVAMTVWALRRGGLGGGGGRDRLRVVAGAACLVFALPWLFAEAGLYAPDPILADEIPLGETLAAVHLGRHHGTDGVLFVLTAVALSRALPSVRGRLAGWLSAYLALMLAYGGAIAAEDFWLEQVVKRGSVEWRLPDLLRPAFAWGWLGIVLGATLAELAWFRRERRAGRGRRTRRDAPGRRSRGEKRAGRRAAASRSP